MPTLFLLAEVWSGGGDALSCRYYTMLKALAAVVYVVNWFDPEIV